MEEQFISYGDCKFFKQKAKVLLRRRRARMRENDPELWDTEWKKIAYFSVLAEFLLDPNNHLGAPCCCPEPREWERRWVRNNGFPAGWEDHGYWASDSAWFASHFSVYMLTHYCPQDSECEESFFCHVQQLLMFVITQHLAHGLCSLRKSQLGQETRDFTFLPD